MAGDNEKPGGSGSGSGGGEKKTSPTARSINIVGAIEPFLEGSNFESYRERLDQFFVTNGVTGALRVSMLCTIIGPYSYEIIRDWASPTKPYELEYEAIMEKLTEYFVKKTNVTQERIKFQRAVQESSENICEYLIRLKRLASKCDFGEAFEAQGDKNKVLDLCLKNQFVYGLSNSALQQEVIIKNPPTIERSFEIAQAYELTKSNSNHMYAQINYSAKKNFVNNKYNSNSNNYNKKQNMYKTNNKNSEDTNTKKESAEQCSKCGKNNHKKEECRAKNWKCFV